MRFLPLVWKNIWRRKFRTIFTLLGLPRHGLRPLPPGRTGPSWPAAVFLLVFVWFELVVPHHGSAGSSTGDFIAAVQPGDTLRYRITDEGVVLVGIRYRLGIFGFLAHLRAVLPVGCAPILITDAGFRGPWFREVERYGWDWIGRVRRFAG